MEWGCAIVKYSYTSVLDRRMEVDVRRRGGGGGGGVSGSSDSKKGWQ